MEHLGVHQNSLKLNTRAFKMQEGKEKTNNKLKPHMASTPGLKHRPYWWKVRVLPTAPALSPCKSTSSTKCDYLEGAVQDKKKNIVP